MWYLVDVHFRPLKPLTCQSVRMEFLAVAPGVHSIDTLTLTDVQSGFTMNLRCAVYANILVLFSWYHRSVMDIVVHEPNNL
jgi:hypothetical protein